MKSAASIAVSGLFLLAAACAQTASTGGEAPPPASAAELPSTATADGPARGRGVVIGHVVTHDAKVSILSRGGDLGVTVHKNDGTLVADAIGLDELRTRDPMLHAVVTSAVASYDPAEDPLDALDAKDKDGKGAKQQKPRKPYVDATLDMRHHN